MDGMTQIYNNRGNITCFGRMSFFCYAREAHDDDPLLKSRGLTLREPIRSNSFTRIQYFYTAISHYRWDYRLVMVFLIAIALNAALFLVFV